ncbi:MAG: hydroxymethylglutaryl-CoA lyase [Pseudomonadota bacterium]
MGEYVEILEVAPRDGLQNEKALVPTADKVRLVEMLSSAGFKRIEVTSFVSPKWVPQLADAEDVMAAITRNTSIGYGALTPNIRGFERARTAKAGWIGIFPAATEGFSKANLNCTIAESLDRFRPVVERALVVEIPVRGSISCVTDCPYDGKVAPGAVADLTAKLLEMGCHEVGLADTIGWGTPESVAAMLNAVLEVASADKLAGHYHDTNGRALDNLEVSLEKGIRVFDAAVGGLGGCPYAPGAKGNVATEAVLEKVTELGFETGLDVAAVRAAGEFARGLRS